MPFRTICLDPPWNERGGGKIKRGADKHYPVMTKSGILAAIRRSGVFDPHPFGCSLWMWATVNHLPDAMWLIDKLGGTYVTNAVWVKAERVMADVAPVDKPSDYQEVLRPQAPGLGQRMRVCHEHLLFARIGKVPVPDTGDRLPSVIYAPRMKHSEKPQEAYDLMERHDVDGDRLDMFARKPRKGWEVWGDEVEG